MSNTTGSALLNEHEYASAIQISFFASLKTSREYLSEY